MIGDSQHAAEFASLDDFIREVEKTRIQALLDRDMALLSQLHAPVYQLITPIGHTYTKDRYLGEIKAGTLRYMKWEPGPMSVRVSEKMAIVRYRVTLELDSGSAQRPSFECWHTDSYELKDDVWQVVWSQATAIR